MQKYVFTVKEDICQLNGKDPSARDLLEKMKLWGSVVDYDSDIAAVKAEYQKTLDELTRQYNAIADQKLTDSEIKLINAYRVCFATDTRDYREQIDKLTKQINDSIANHEKMKQILLNAIQS